MSLALDLRPKQIKVMLDKERTIQFDMRSIEALQGDTEDLIEVFKAIQRRGVNKNTVMKMLWAGLATDFYRNGEELTPDDLIEYVGIGSIAELSTILTSAFTQALPDPKEAKKGKNAETP